MKWIRNAHFDEMFGELLAQLEEDFDNGVDESGYRPVIENEDSLEIVDNLRWLWTQAENALWDIPIDKGVDTEQVDYLLKIANEKVKNLVLSLFCVLAWTKPRID